MLDHTYLPNQLINAVLQYLSTQPYQAVAGLISAIQEEAKKQGQTEQKPAE